MAREAHFPNLEVAVIKGIKFASIPVRNQDLALAFYTEKLGFRVHTDQPFDDRQRWIELRIPGADTRLVLFTADGEEDRIGSSSNISFMSDNVEETYRQLSGRGVEFIETPQGAEWGTYAIFRDLDGNRFVLSSR